MESTHLHDASVGVADRVIVLHPQALQVLSVCLPRSLTLARRRTFDQPSPQLTTHLDQAALQVARARRLDGRVHEALATSHAVEVEFLRKRRPTLVRQ